MYELLATQQSSLCWLIFHPVLPRIQVVYTNTHPWCLSGRSLGLGLASSGSAYSLYDLRATVKLPTPADRAHGSD